MNIKTAFPNFADSGTLLKNIRQVLKSGRMMNGPYNEQFESNFAAYSEAKHAVAVNSCTTALEISLRYIGVTGGEVIVPTNTFIATPNAVIFAGGKPVLADIAPGTYCLAPTEVERLINKRTRAVIVVHIAGLIHPNILAIRKICNKYALPLIEDCAHAAGARFQNKHAGTFGFAGCFSFYPTKNITTGTGGMIITNDSRLNDYARRVRIHGAGKNLADIVDLGNDWFLDEVRACLGIHQIQHLDGFLKHRQNIARIYDRLVATSNWLIKQKFPDLCSHSYYKYPLQVNLTIKEISKLRKEFAALFGFELETVYWPTCHMQPLYRNQFGYRIHSFPVAESILSHQICLPIHSRLSTADAKTAFINLHEEIERRDKS